MEFGSNSNKNESTRIRRRQRFQNKFKVVDICKEINKHIHSKQQAPEKRSKVEFSLSFLSKIAKRESFASGSEKTWVKISYIVAGIEWCSCEKCFYFLLNRHAKRVQNLMPRLHEEWMKKFFQTSPQHFLSTFECRVH